jgi:hypothetical protein
LNHDRKSDAIAPACGGRRLSFSVLIAYNAGAHASSDS